MHRTLTDRSLEVPLSPDSSRRYGLGTLDGTPRHPRANVTLPAELRESFTAIRALAERHSHKCAMRREAQRQTREAFLAPVQQSARAAVAQRARGVVRVSSGPRRVRRAVKRAARRTASAGRGSRRRGHGLCPCDWRGL